MNAQAAKMLTKGLFIRKKKGKVQNDGSKRVKVGVSSSRVPTSTVAPSEVIVETEIAPTIEVDTASMSSMPSMPSGPSNGDRVSELSIKKRIGRKKKVVMKTSFKARLGGPDGDDNKQEEDPFDNPEIIQNLADRFAMPEVVDQMADLNPRQLIWSSLGTILKLDHQMLTHIKRMRRQKVQHRRPRRTFEPRFIIFKRGSTRTSTLPRRRQRTSEVFKACSVKRSSPQSN
ncbi:hypothetical protein COCNU_scaffold001232G000010 [Cocos nucifera]|nr:hypothetical protein [Cocos nucifera]